jgi:hypothetical protein
MRGLQLIGLRLLLLQQRLHWHHGRHAHLLLLQLLGHVPRACQLLLLQLLLWHHVHAPLLLLWGLLQHVRPIHLLQLLCRHQHGHVSHACQLLRVQLLGLLQLLPWRHVRHIHLMLLCCHVRHTHLQLQLLQLRRHGDHIVHIIHRLVVLQQLCVRHIALHQLLLLLLRPC